MIRKIHSAVKLNIMNIHDHNYDLITIPPSVATVFETNMYPDILNFQACDSNNVELYKGILYENGIRINRTYNLRNIPTTVQNNKITVQLLDELGQTYRSSYTYPTYTTEEFVAAIMAYYRELGSLDGEMLDPTTPMMSASDSFDNLWLGINAYLIDTEVDPSVITIIHDNIREEYVTGEFDSLIDRCEFAFEYIRTHYHALLLTLYSTTPYDGVVVYFYYIQNRSRNVYISTCDINGKAVFNIPTDTGDHQFGLMRISIEGPSRRIFEESGIVDYRPATLFSSDISDDGLRVFVIVVPSNRFTYSFNVPGYSEMTPTPIPEYIIFYDIDNGDPEIIKMAKIYRGESGNFNFTLDTDVNIEGMKCYIIGTNMEEVSTDFYDSTSVSITPIDNIQYLTLIDDGEAPASEFYGKITYVSKDNIPFVSYIHRPYDYIPEPPSMGYPFVNYFSSDNGKYGRIEVNGYNEYVTYLPFTVAIPDDGSIILRKDNYTHSFSVIMDEDEIPNAIIKIGYAFSSDGVTTTRFVRYGITDESGIANVHIPMPITLIDAGFGTFTYEILSIYTSSVEFTSFTESEGTISLEYAEESDDDNVVIHFFDSDFPEATDTFPLHVNITKLSDNTSIFSGYIDRSVIISNLDEFTTYAISAYKPGYAATSKVIRGGEAPRHSIALRSTEVSYRGDLLINIYDKNNGKPLNSCRLSLKDLTDTYSDTHSDSNGIVFINDIIVNKEYNIAISKEGYGTYIGSVVIPTDLGSTSDIIYRTTVEFMPLVSFTYEISMSAHPIITLSFGLTPSIENKVVNVHLDTDEQYTLSVGHLSDATGTLTYSPISIQGVGKVIIPKNTDFTFGEKIETNNIICKIGEDFIMPGKITNDSKYYRYSKTGDVPNTTGISTYSIVRESFTDDIYVHLCKKSAIQINYKVNGFDLHEYHILLTSDYHTVTLTNGPTYTVFNGYLDLPYTITITGPGVKFTGTYVFTMSDVTINLQSVSIPTCGITILLTDAFGQSITNKDFNVEVISTITSGIAGSMPKTLKKFTTNSQGMLVFSAPYGSIFNIVNVDTNYPITVYGSVPDKPQALFRASTTGVLHQEYVFTLASGGTPIRGASVWITLDADGLCTVASPKMTDLNGNVYFMLNPAWKKVYAWYQLSGVVNGKSIWNLEED